MQLVESFLALCASAALLFSVALACKADKGLEKVNERIDELEGEVEEVLGARNVRADDGKGE